MFTIAICLALIPLAAFADWLNFIRSRRSPYEVELTRASHGIALVVMSILSAYLAERYRLTWYLPADLRPYVWPAAAGISLFGGYWFALGAARTRSYFRNAQLIARASTKLSLELVLAFMALCNLWLLPTFLRRDLTRDAMLAVAGWCAITAITKLFLLLRRRMPRVFVNIQQMPHGNAGFATRLGPTSWDNRN